MNNKNRIDSYIPAAIDALKKCGIATKDNKIDSSFRGQISSFGASVAIGSFKQAVAFFAQDAKSPNSKINRSMLIVAINYILTGNKETTAEEICNSILKLEDVESLENKYLDAAVALKLAMSIFDLK